MKWLKKKDGRSPALQENKAPEKCNHVWKDFPWYIDANYWIDTQKQECSLYEPYVCVKCKKRKDVLLERRVWAEVSYEDGSKHLNKFHEEYKDNIEGRATIEDMINDFQLVDRRELEILDFLHGNLHTDNSMVLSITRGDGTEVKVKVD